MMMKSRQKMYNVSEQPQSPPVETVPNLERKEGEYLVSDLSNNENSASTLSGTLRHKYGTRQNKAVTIVNDECATAMSNRKEVYGIKRIKSTKSEDTPSEGNPGTNIELENTEPILVHKDQNNDSGSPSIFQQEASSSINEPYITSPAADDKHFASIPTLTSAEQPNLEPSTSCFARRTSNITECLQPKAESNSSGLNFKQSRIQFPTLKNVHRGLLSWLVLMIALLVCLLVFINQSSNHQLEKREVHIPYINSILLDVVDNAVWKTRLETVLESRHQGNRPEKALTLLYFCYRPEDCEMAKMDIIAQAELKLDNVISSEDVGPDLAGELQQNLTQILLADPNSLVVFPRIAFEMLRVLINCLGENGQLTHSGKPVRSSGMIVALFFHLHETLVSDTNVTAVTQLVKSRLSDSLQPHSGVKDEMGICLAFRRRIDIVAPVRQRCKESDDPAFAKCALPSS